jgi:type II secretory ATPase GspE/PulE/Tfp pilus assembly ATPase PilB-like protein
MSTVELPEASPAPVLRGPSALHWPLPHHMRVIDPGADSEPERGMVTLNDGTKLLGKVVRIDFEGGILDFVPETGPRRELPFATFRSLYLSRTVELERIPLAVPPGSVEALPSLEKRKCAIVLTNGSTLEADVVSVVPRQPGLFLFVANYADEVLRWFVPAEAIGRYSIGEPLGQALRARKAIEPDALDAGLRTQHRLQHTKIGDYLADQGSVTRAQLESALLRQKTMTHLRLGDALIQEGLITIAQRDAALALQATDRRKLLGEILVDMGAVTRETIRGVLVEQLGVPSVNLVRFQYDPNAVKAISADLARKHVVMPLYRTATRIAVGIENPLSWEALQELEFFTGLKVDPAMAAREDLLAAITQIYGGTVAGAPIAQIVAELKLDSQATEVAEVAVTESDNILVRLVNKIIMDAFDQGASDIHIESMAGDKPSRVRFRVDGILAPYIDVPSNFRAALISRLKIMSVLDISERRRPQDGKIRFENFGPRKIELRVVTMPTTNGLEDVVMRILAAPRSLTLDQLALSPRILPELKAMAARSFGLVLVCGPTGSGKTTTLHSLLGHINTPHRKIWTVEDPIEISQDGLCQVQVNAKLGLSFPEVLRSFLRADPDVIMVGEMRDPETARTVIAASLTGHLVLSTMHTNSAVESVIRLLDLGLDPFNFSDALLGIVGQRLVRRLCTTCRTPHEATSDEIDALAQQYCRVGGLDPHEITMRWRSRYGSSNGTLALHSAVGCALCDGSGYKGRMGVHELLAASPGIKAKIQAKATSAEILREALDGGMVTLEQDAIEKILQGHLDFEQVQAACL